MNLNIIKLIMTCSLTLDISDLNNIKNASVNSKISALTIDGKTYIAGLLNNKIKDYFEPIEIDNVVETIVCEDRIYILNNKGNVFSKNPSIGDLKPLKIYKGKSDPATSIKGGDNHLLILTKSGKVYGVGDNSKFQLVPFGKSYYDLPVQILLKDHIKHTGELNITNANEIVNNCEPNNFSDTLTKTALITISPVLLSGIEAMITLPVVITISYTGSCCKNKCGELIGTITFQMISAIILSGTYINAGGSNDIEVSSDIDIFPLINASIGQTFLLNNFTCSTLLFQLSFSLNNLAVFTEINNTIELSIPSESNLSEQFTMCNYTIEKIGVVTPRSTILSIVGGSVSFSSSPPIIITKQINLTVNNNDVEICCCVKKKDIVNDEIDSTFNITSNIQLPITLNLNVPADLIIPVNISGIVIGSSGSITFKITSVILTAGTFTGYYVGGTFQFSVNSNLDLTTLLSSQSYTISFSSCYATMPFPFPLSEILFQLATITPTTSGFNINVNSLSTTIEPIVLTNIIHSNINSTITITNFILNPLNYIPTCMLDTQFHNNSNERTMLTSNNTPINFDPIPFIITDTNVTFDIITLPIFVSGIISGSCYRNSDGYLFGTVIICINDIVVKAGIYEKVNVPVSFNLIPLIDFSRKPNITQAILLDHNTCDILPIDFFIPFIQPQCTIITNGIEFTIDNEIYYIKWLPALSPPGWDQKLSNITLNSTIITINPSTLIPCCPCVPSSFVNDNFIIMTNISINLMLNGNNINVILPVDIICSAVGECCAQVNGDLTGNVTYTISNMIIPGNGAIYSKAIDNKYDLTINGSDINLFYLLYPNQQLIYQQILTGLNCDTAIINTIFSFNSSGVFSNAIQGINVNIGKNLSFLTFSGLTTNQSMFSNINFAITAKSNIPCCQCQPIIFSEVPFNLPGYVMTLHNILLNTEPASISFPLSIYGTLTGSCCFNSNGTLAGSVTVTIIKLGIEHNVLTNFYAGIGISYTEHFDVMVTEYIDLMQVLMGISQTFNLVEHSCLDTDSTFNFPLFFNESNISITDTGNDILIKILDKESTIMATTGNLQSSTNSKFTNFSIFVPVSNNLPCCNCSPKMFNNIPVTISLPLILNEVAYGNVITNILFTAQITAVLIGNCCINDNSQLYGTAMLQITKVMIIPGNNSFPLNGIFPFNITSVLDLEEMSFVFNGLICNDPSLTFNYPLNFLPTITNSTNGIQINKMLMTSDKLLQITEYTYFEPTSFPYSLPNNLPCCNGSSSNIADGRELKSRSSSNTVNNISYGPFILPSYLTMKISIDSIVLVANVNGTYEGSYSINSDLLTGNMTFNITSILVPSGTYVNDTNLIISHDLEFINAFIQPPEIIFDGTISCDGISTFQQSSLLNTDLISITTINDGIGISIDNGEIITIITDTLILHPVISMDFRITGSIIASLLPCCLTEIDNKTIINNFIVKKQIKDCKPCYGSPLSELPLGKRQYPTIVKNIQQVNERFKIPETGRFKLEDNFDKIVDVSKKINISIQENPRRNRWDKIYAGNNTSILQEDSRTLWVLGTIFPYSGIADSPVTIYIDDSTLEGTNVVPSLANKPTITIYNKFSYGMKQKVKKYIEWSDDLSIKLNSGQYFINGEIYDSNYVIVLKGTDDNLKIMIDNDYEILLTSHKPDNFTIEFNMNENTMLYYGNSMGNDSKIINTYLRSGDIVNLNRTGQTIPLTPDLPTVYTFKTDILDVAIGNNLTVLTNDEIRIINRKKWEKINTSYFFCPVKRIFSESDVTFYITEDYRIYATGKFDGLFDSKNPIKLRNISRSIRAQQIAISKNQIIIVGADDIYGMGNNKLGQLGYDCNYEISKFIKLVLTSNNFLT